MKIIYESSAIKQYRKLLGILGSLSRLFSESDTPYLNYRIAENIYCKVFDADNLSRSDCSADARIGNFGIGLKTFINGKSGTYQKIAEFNRDRDSYVSLIDKEKDFVNTISNLRNRRLETTKAVHNIDKMIYHCISREANKFLFFEENMDMINLDRVTIVSTNTKSISFNDGLNDYKFNHSKSTLYKKFNTINPLSIDIDIIANPYDVLEQLFAEENYPLNKKETSKEYVILPLYSSKSGKVVSINGMHQVELESIERYISLCLFGCIKHFLTFFH